MFGSLNGGTSHSIFQELERAALGGNSPSVKRQGRASATDRGDGCCRTRRRARGLLPAGQQRTAMVSGARLWPHLSLRQDSGPDCARTMQGGPAPWPTTAHCLPELRPAGPESPLWPRTGTAAPAQPQQAEGREGLLEVFQDWRNRSWRAPNLPPPPCQGASRAGRFRACVGCTFRSRSCTQVTGTKTTTWSLVDFLVLVGVTSTSHR